MGKHSSFSKCYLYFFLCLFTTDAVCSLECRHLEFNAKHAFQGKRLKNHVIRVHDNTMVDFCEALCYMEPNCASYNFMVDNGNKENICELNNSTHEAHFDDLEENPSYVYHGSRSSCVGNPCKNNGSCQTGFTERHYRCLCAAGFTGQDCEVDVDECTSGANECSANAECRNTEGSYSCTCKPGRSGDGRNCVDVNECTSGASDCSADAECSNTEGSYSCTCKPGFSGDGRNCVDVDECTSGANDCGADSECNNTEGSYSCTCKPGLSGDGRNCVAITCEYLYQTTSVSTSPYCSLGVCGVGQWKLVMKIDGTKQTFHYTSQYWSNEQEYNPSGGQTGFDTQETKLQTYWNTPFSKICLGMKIGQQLNFVVINKQANSVHSLIADGQYRNTSLGRDTWKTLIGSEASLQRNCNEEGFNAGSLHNDQNLNAKARIGIVANEQDTCNSCDSKLGFGTKGRPDDSNTYGNGARWEPDNGDKEIRAMGYIFIQ